MNASMKRRGFLALAAGLAVGARHLADLPAEHPLGWPPEMTVEFWPDGSYILNDGSLELGIVRDSSTFVTNQFPVFRQVFENQPSLGYATTADGRN